MEKYDVIIVGAGLGGLLSANILSREGYNVCVIEKNPQLGGCLQVFGRDKCIFNTGLNYTEALGEGQILNRYFKYFGIMDELPVKQLDKDCFELVTFKDREYKFAQGHENFIETLSAQFPSEKDHLKRYIAQLGTACNQFPLYNIDAPLNFNADVFEGKSAYDYLSSVTPNYDLQQVLAGTNLLYAGVKNKTPMYIHALINYSFITSAWRIPGGSHQLVQLLAKSIINNGGTILKRKQVEKLVLEKNEIKYVQLSDGDKLSAKYVISNMHPSKTLTMLEGDFSRKAYYKRIIGLENTTGMFTLYIVLKENTFKYINYNHYYYATDTVWTTEIKDTKSWPLSYMLYTPSSTKEQEYATNMIAMTYMSIDELKQWENSSVGNRGERYEAFKLKKAEQLLDLIENKFPVIRSCIKSYYTSTPLTYRDYTGTPDGSAYGVLKDYQNPIGSIVLPKTKIPNLFFTGQNLNLHGILGVTIGAVMTCGELVGLNRLIEKIKKA
jgi:all-trans-retinol 13,14-reductase